MKIIADSTCDIPLEEAKEKGIEIIPMTLFFGKKEYIDKVTITDSEFYKKLSETSEPPKTTLINSGRFLEEFEKYPDEEILVICLSSELSGTYGCACTACGMTERKDIRVLDTKSVTIGSALLIDEAVRMRNEGKTLDEIFDSLCALREKIKVIAAVDTLKYLVLGGRISGFSGKIGTLLNIKPIICSDNGKIINIGKARGRTAAFEKLRENVLTTFRMDMSRPLLYAHTGDKESVDLLKKIIGRDAPDYILGSIVGTHAGPGTVGIAYFTE